MNEQTIYFLQSLYDDLAEREKKSDEPDFLAQAKEKITETGRLAAAAEMNRYLTGFLSRETILVSPRAKQLAANARKLMSEMQEISYPHELRPLSSAAHKLIGEIQALLIITVRSLTSEYGPNRSDIHFIVRQLAPSALVKIRRRCYLLHYRNFILTGGQNMNSRPPDSDDLRQWLDFYLNVLGTETDSITDEEADGRWAYALRRVMLKPNLSVEQFIKVQSGSDALTIPPGKAKIGSGAGGALKISGRGYLTNLKEDDYTIMRKNEFVKHIPDIKNYSFLKGISADPNINLCYIFSGQKYLISSTEYFRMLNRCIVSHTLGLRVRQGSCIFCGSIMSGGKCLKCGEA